MIRQLDLGPGLGQLKYTSLLKRLLRLGGGVRAAITITEPNSLQTRPLAEVDGEADGVGERETMGGEPVKLTTPVVDGVETVVAEDGETAIQEAGARLQTILGPVVVDGEVEGAVQRRIVGGERAKPTTTIVAGVGEIPVESMGRKTTREEGVGARPQMILVPVEEDGEAIREEGVGARLQTILVPVAVDGVLPPRTTTPRILSNQQPRKKATHQLRLRRKTPGVHRITTGGHLTTPGVRPITLGARPLTPGDLRITPIRLVGVPRTTLGALQTKLLSRNLPVTPVTTNGMGRSRAPVPKLVVGQVGATRRTLKLSLPCPHPGEEAGGIPLRPYPQQSVQLKVMIPNILRMVCSRGFPCAFSDTTNTTSRHDVAPATMDVDKGEQHFEGKAILNAIESAVQRRRKRKRSHENISEYPRYYRHLLAPQRDQSSGVDGDGDAVMGDTQDRTIRGESLEAGEIIEPPPSVEYDMNILSREPKTSEEKINFARHLL